MKPLLLADHNALEFLDTSFLSRGESVELLGNGRAFLEWLVDAGLLDASLARLFRERFTESELDAAAAEARKTRLWLGDWLMRWSVEPNARYVAELRRLNTLLERSRAYLRVARNDRGELVTSLRPHGESVNELLALVAAAVADLMTNEDPSLIKRCDGAECTLWFLDRTKAHRRRFCSVSACGNREKVAAFRERRRREAASA